MQDLYAAQLELEAQYHHESVLKSIKMTQDALDQGRAADISVGKRIVAAAFGTVKEALSTTINKKAGNSKYRPMLERCDLDVLCVAALRHVLGCCAESKKHTFQDVVRQLGHMLETEALIQAVDTAAPAYTAKTLSYLDSTKTTSVSHRNRTFTAAAHNVQVQWVPWTAEERVGTGRLIMTALWETGLFRWEDFYEGRGRVKPIQIIKPTKELEDHLTKAVAEAKSHVQFPPMLVPPRPWESIHSGGYLTEWYQHRAPMVRLRAPKDIRQWIVKNLGEGKAEILKAAMNKAQSTPYRVNKTVLGVLEKAIAMGDGRMGLPHTMPPAKPPFPYEDGFDKATATPAQLEEIKAWKAKMSSWYTREATRFGQSAGMLARLRDLRRYQGYANLYFPTFVDWRGRLYFRGTLTPQSNDAVKGCLDFAEGKPLGDRGLFWLKVHIANCAGYDKHLPELKVKWVDQNMQMLMDFFNDPLYTEAPEPDTAFTLYRALLAYTEATSLADPSQYICNVPIAMDATCSGLQHFSALLRDSVGGKFTNLTYEGGDQKEDIYRHVGQLSDTSKLTYTKDAVIQEYWRRTPIPRNMAKRPVMTYVYGSTLKSTLDYVSTHMVDIGAEPVRDDNGDILYTLNKLAVPVGKALRQAVADTVPSAAAGMAFLQELVKGSVDPVRWITPAGMPVVNWSEKTTQKNLKIRSMGREAALFKLYTGIYDKTKAASGMSPNYVHSMDSAHLCITLASTDIQIVPIHDSFGTHPCDVDELHRVLRKTFLELYCEDHLSRLLSNVVMREGYDIQIPPYGELDLERVLDSPFMFC